MMYRISPYTSTKRNKDLFDIFDDFFSDTRAYKGNLKVDVQDLEKEYIIEADVPGFKKEEIEVHFENEKLIISVNKEMLNENDENDKYIHRERFCESLTRSIYLKDVDPSKFKAKLDNGVLTITALKAEDKVNKYMIDIE